MQEHINQARHNLDFHDCICKNYSNKFFDWKITCLFYTAIHYLKALAARRGIDIGDTHYEIEKNVSPDRNGPNKMLITRGAWREYNSLNQYSRTARYNGMTDYNTFEMLMERDHGFCLTHIDNFRKYIKSQGVDLDKK